jgi:hypothetical protein
MLVSAAPLYPRGRASSVGFHHGGTCVPALALSFWFAPRLHPAPAPQPTAGTKKPPIRGVLDSGGGIETPTPDAQESVGRPTPHERTLASKSMSGVSPAVAPNGSPRMAARGHRRTSGVVPRRRRSPATPFTRKRKRASCGGAFANRPQRAQRGLNSDARSSARTGATRRTSSWRIRGLLRRSR